jgi:N-acetylmuramoyl-L-alanine amidase
LTKKFNCIRKNNLGEIALALAVVASVTAFSLNLFSPRQETFRETPEKTLVIDAGHGGLDGGATGADGSRESDINLEIALKLEAMAGFFGEKSLMTRKDDNCGADAADYSEHRELERRTELINSAADAVLISIHQNCYPTAQPSGAHVLYSPNGQSEELAELLYGNIKTALEPQNRRLPAAGDDIYILENADCPAVLIECGFVSNHSDITKLTDSDYQTSLAAVMMASYIQYRDNVIQT